MRTYLVILRIVDSDIDAFSAQDIVSTVIDSIDALAGVKVEVVLQEEVK